MSSEGFCEKATANVSRLKASWSSLAARMDDWSVVACGLVPTSAAARKPAP